MTRNLYLGADLSPTLSAPTVAGLAAATASVFSVVQRTDFRERAKVLAKEIVDADPVLLGIQEAAVWSSGPLNDPAPATHVEYDFIAILRQELGAAGAPYDVVGVQAEADIEAPAAAPYLRDIRLVQQDAVLVKVGARRELEVGDVRSANFVNHLVLTTGTGQLTQVKRGWVSAEVAVNRRRFRFVTTHLEAFSASIRLQQAQELLAPEGPIGSAPAAVILAGDLNSGPELPVPENRLAFEALTSAGLVDTWSVANRGDPGFTAGFSELLDDPRLEGALEHRVDHVMAKGPVEVVGVRRYGIDPDNRTASGMWPSDHAGVLARLVP